MCLGARCAMEALPAFLKRGTETGDEFFFKKGCAPFNAQLPSGHLSRRHRPNGDELCGV